MSLGTDKKLIIKEGMSRLRVDYSTNPKTHLLKGK
jgi:hypothetical protein